MPFNFINKSAVFLCARWAWSWISSRKNKENRIDPGIDPCAVSYSVMHRLDTVELNLIT